MAEFVVEFPIKDPDGGPNTYKPNFDLPFETPEQAHAFASLHNMYATCSAEEAVVTMYPDTPEEV